MSDSFADMRGRNALRLIELVRGHGQLSRAELSRLSGLSKATVSSIIEDLIAIDLLQETGAIPINKGRFPTGLVFNPRARVVVGLMVEDDRISFICTVDCTGQLIDLLEVTSNKQSSISKILAPLEQAGYSNSVLAIGIAAPGPISTKQPFLSQVSKQLRKEFGKQPCIETLVNCGALAETAEHAEPATASLFIRSGQTVRSTLLIGGKIITRSADQGGDLGHISLSGRSEICECGNRGCVNAVASEAAIRARLDKRDRLKATGLASIVALCQRGNKSAIDAVGLAGQGIGQAIGSMLNVLAPANVVVSGELLDAGSVFWAPLVRGVKQQALRQNFACSTLQTSSKGPGAPAFGAALLALQNVDALETLV